MVRIPRRAWCDGLTKHDWRNNQRTTKKKNAVITKIDSRCTTGEEGKESAGLRELSQQRGVSAHLRPDLCYTFPCRPLLLSCLVA